MSIPDNFIKGYIKTIINTIQKQRQDPNCLHHSFILLIAVVARAIKTIGAIEIKKDCRHSPRNF